MQSMHERGSVKRNKKYTEWNGNESTAYQNLWDTAMVLREISSMKYKC